MCTNSCSSVGNDGSSFGLLGAIESVLDKAGDIITAEVNLSSGIEGDRVM